MRTQEQIDYDNFMMDLENWVLENRWDSRIGIPRGPERHMDPLWAEVMQEELRDYPRKSWADYCHWVESGKGDDWFQPDEISDQGYIEAQAKQRTAYLCRGTVMPLGASLYDRIVPIAVASLSSAGTE